jgi:DNA mismatch repair protein MutS
VARLAGVPAGVIERAKEILAQLEHQDLDALGHAKIARSERKSKSGELQLTLFAAAHPLVDELRTLALDETAPLAAWQWLERWQKKLGEER